METLTFLRTVSKLKDIHRTGWIGMVPEPESVADHCFGVAVLAMTYAPRLGLDAHKCLQLALVHDMAEAEVGDIVSATWGKELGNRPDKEAKEQAAAAHIFSLVDDLPMAELFEEYHRQETPESRLVRQLDKVEVFLQALSYELRTGRDLEEFYVTAARFIEEPALLELIQEIQGLRPQHVQGK